MSDSYPPDWNALPDLTGSKQSVDAFKKPFANSQILLLTPALQE